LKTRRQCGTAARNFVPVLDELVSGRHVLGEPGSAELDGEGSPQMVFDGNQSGRLLICGVSVLASGL
jgi:hypothetical protein